MEDVVKRGLMYKRIAGFLSKLGFVLFGGFGGSCLHSVLWRLLATNSCKHSGRDVCSG